MVVIETENKQERALKIIDLKSCESFGKGFIEVTFNMMFKGDLPLLDMENVYFQYDPNKLEKFTLFIEMALADGDMDSVI